MYVSPNFKSKKAINEAIAKGKTVTIFQPNDMGLSPIPTDGTVTVEGPHYPEPHRWYGQATLKDGKVIKVK